MWWPVGSLRCAWFALLLQVHIFGRRDPLLLLTYKALPGQSPEYITDSLLDELRVTFWSFPEPNWWKTTTDVKMGIITITRCWLRKAEMVWLLLLSTHIISVIHCPLQTLHIINTLHITFTHTDTNKHTSVISFYIQSKTYFGILPNLKLILPLQLMWNTHTHTDALAQTLCAHRCTTDRWNTLCSWFLGHGTTSQWRSVGTSPSPLLIGT